ncbi:B3 domain-containing transcription factor VRN1-like [Vicia villosa]|uniref:B3 domain-containing transcription factor VRN1-like n=1 Tax=Vicia villosa TaxID=3911 RepID=UPI00273B5D87|nr:B3 domain-containing transcription factor VRN1-like [Vicia villosa]
MAIRHPRFFKVMQNHKEEIRLPKKFVEKYWKGISNPVLLILPNGVEHKVFWIERDGDIWFQKNWEKLAKFLKCNYFLTFKFICESHFKVKIYDTTTLEIDYSHIKFVSEVDEGVKEAEDVIEVSDNRDKSLDESEPSKHVQMKKVNGKRKSMDFDPTHEKISGTSIGSMTEMSKECQTTEAMNENPRFEVKLTPSSIQNYRLRIPTDFSREYLNKFNGTTTMRVGEDGTMKVKIKFDDIYSRSIVSGGWTRIVKKYKLHVNDVCIFEMIQLQPPSFVITIIRGEEDPSSKKLKGYKEGKSCDNIAKRKDIPETSRSCPKLHVLDDLEDNSVTKKNIFEVVVNSSYPCVPNAFMNRHVGCHGKFLELKVEEKSWFVKLSYYPTHSTLYAGWRKFRKECKLEAGDICFFELVDENKCVFKVSFERNNLGEDVRSV